MSQRIAFTPEQKKAIKHDKGHLQIIACPGSGKTEVVSQRVAQMIKNGVDPKTIVAITFTEKAADELKSRIRGILDVVCKDRADFGDMFVGTIHAFCFYMLKEIDPAYRSYDVLDDPKKIAFLSKGMNYYDKVKLVDLQEKHGIRHYQTIKGFVEGADIVMTENINVSRLGDKQFAKCYRKYRRVLDDEKYFDFSSILNTFVEEIGRDREKRKRLGKLVKHVILDEYQDVNLIQEKILELLSRGADSVCVVGDDDQNIYHWRGSDVNFIRTFRDRYRKKYKVSRVYLDTNFRSTKQIVHTARKFIEHNVRRLDKEMKHNPQLKRKYEEGDIMHHHFNSDQEEFQFIVSKIRQLKKTNFLDKRNNPYSLSLKDFAVLVRTNEDAAHVINFLDENDIDCIAYSGESIFDHPEVALAMDCIGYVFSCRGYTMDDVPEISDLRTRYSRVFDTARFRRADHRKFGTKLKKIRGQADKIRRKSPKDYLPGLGLQEFFHKILNAMGAEDFGFGDVYNYNLAALSTAVSDYETVWTRLRTKQVEGFFYFVFAYAGSHYSDAQHSDNRNIEAVNVLTIHKAKGLEFPVVFMPVLVDKQKPRERRTFVDTSLYDVDKYIGSVEDQRRTFYTAATRSEKYLFLTGSKNRTGKMKKYKPNKFIAELDGKYISDVLSTPKPRSKLKPRQQTIGVFPTSFSQLSCYGRCPEDYRLRHIYGFNAGVPINFGYGANIHNILNWIHRRFIDKGKIPKEGEIAKTFDRIFKLRYATRKIAEIMKKKGRDVASNYVRIHKDDFKRILETEKKFEFVIDKALISGQIDLLKKLDNKGRVTEVEIIDFKTDKKDGVYNLDHDKQLRYYAIACLRSLGLKPEKAYVHLLDQDKKHYVDISENKLDKTKIEIKKQVGRILDDRFPAKPSKRNCEMCDYRGICHHKNYKTGVEFTN